MIRFGLAVPQRLAASETLDVGGIAEVARRAEDLDYRTEQASLLSEHVLAAFE